MRGLDERKGTNRTRIIMLVVGLVLIVGLSISGMAKSISKLVFIVDNGREMTVDISAKTVGEVLQKKNIFLGENDFVNPDISSELERGMTITISRTKKLIIQDGEREVEVITLAPTVGTLIEEQGINLGENDVLDKPLNQVLNNGERISIARNTETFETVHVAIPAGTVTRASFNIPNGETRLAREGIDGLREDTYKVVHINGVPADRVLVSQETIQKPVSAIVEQGHANNVASRGEMRYRAVLDMTATAYTNSPAENGGYTTTATGAALVKGAIAVDPKVIPLGTRLYIESSDGTYVYGYGVASDTGGAIKGSRLDLCMDSYSEAIQFGRRTVKVYILE